jgi:type II secretory pathway component PulM
MGRLRGLIDDLSDYLGAASPRERRLMLLAGGGLLAFVVLVTAGSVSSAIRRKEDAVEEKRLAFEKIQRLAQNYGEKEQERQLLEAKLRQSPPALMSFVDERAKAEGIEVGGMSDRGVVSGGTAGKPKESSVEVNLGKVPLEKLAKLLKAIEQSPGVVRIRRLRVRKSTDNKETLDVTLTISAWQGA